MAKPLSVGGIDILLQDITPPEATNPDYDGRERRTQSLKAGWRKSPGNAAFVADTIRETNVQVPMRDGVRLLVDIYRPDDSDAVKVPALIAWSPYGKSGGMFKMDAIPGRVGVPRSRLSGFEKFEAPDPAEWTARGYAIFNPDVRGVNDSEGNILHFGTAEGQDGYDMTEEIAQMPWCNRSVAFVGNSWLGIAQWFIAAERPPHLKCIAPLEGAADVYRDLVCRGGIPQLAFWDFLLDSMNGRSKQEDVSAMLNEYPQYNEYWQDKRAKIEKIEVPAYVLASYSTGLHTFGSFRGFQELRTEQKWLRVHATQEWHDLYKKSTNDELQAFFDRFTKGIQNDWEQTPKVRASVVRFNESTLVNLPLPNWPPPTTNARTFFLSSEASLADTPPLTSGTAFYKADVPAMQMDNDAEELCFSYTFDKPCTILGSSRATLYMSTKESDDMDVFVQIRKADKDGNILQNQNIPMEDWKAINDDELEPLNTLFYLGPTGCLRASYRALNEELSDTFWAEHDFVKPQKLPRGEIVKLDVGLWQTGMQFEPGEKLVLKIAGHSMTLAEFPNLRGVSSNENKGRHQLHFGGEYASQIVVPTVDIA